MCPHASWNTLCPILGQFAYLAKVYTNPQSNSRKERTAVEVHLFAGAVNPCIVSGIRNGWHSRKLAEVQPDHDAVLQCRDRPGRTGPVAKQVGPVA